MISFGPRAYPKRQPVIAYDFENPLITIVRSAIPSSDAIDICGVSPYVSSP